MNIEQSLLGRIQILGQLPKLEFTTRFWGYSPSQVNSAFLELAPLAAVLRAAVTDSDSRKVVESSREFESAMMQLEDFSRVRFDSQLRGYCKRQVEEVSRQIQLWHSELVNYLDV